MYSIYFKFWRCCTLLSTKTILLCSVIELVYNFIYVYFNFGKYSFFHRWNWYDYASTILEQLDTKVSSMKYWEVPKSQVIDTNFGYRNFHNEYLFETNMFVRAEEVCEYRKCRNRKLFARMLEKNCKVWWNTAASRVLLSRRIYCLFWRPYRCSLL